MQEIYTYHIEVLGQVDEKVFNITSPIQVTVEQGNAVSTLLTLHTDQSGLVGLVRHLHHQGFVILSLSRTALPSPSSAARRRLEQ